METQKVTMGLPVRDVNRVKMLKDRLHVTTNASAVSAAIGIAKSVTDAAVEGATIYIQKKDGTREKLVIAGLGDE